MTYQQPIESDDLNASWKSAATISELQSSTLISPLQYAKFGVMRKHLTTEQGALAAKLRGIGISESYASQLVNRKRTPSFALALKIKSELGIDPEFWSSSDTLQIAN